MMQEEPEQDGERDAQPVVALEAQVDRHHEQQRDDEHHAEMVRVARERVHSVDARLADRTPDVDRRRAAGDRVEDERVEVPAGERRHELQQAVRRVRCKPGDEPRDRPPVEALGAAREVGDPRGEEREVDHELRQPLLVQRERLFVSRLKKPNR